MVGGAGDDELVDGGGVDGPRVVEDRDLVGPVEDAGVAIEVAVVRLVVVVVVVEQAEAEMVGLGRNVVDDDGVFALLLGVKSGVDPVIAGSAGVGAGDTH